MNGRFARIAATAADHHGMVSLDALRIAGIPASTVSRWVQLGLLNRLGPRSFAVVGCPGGWQQAAAAALADVGMAGVLAGRTGARLYRLDGFASDKPEVLLQLPLRRNRTDHTVASTSRPITRADITKVDGLLCLRPERLILDSPLFNFTREETENAIDSALRLRLVSEQRLRTRAIERHTRGINGGRLLLDALVDTGGESRLERWFLKIARQAGLPRPVLQKTFRSGSRTVARVDALFPGGLVVEVAGHGTHATRRQRQIDAQRHTELTLRGLRVLTFTYEDIRDRPQWVIARIREALVSAA